MADSTLAAIRKKIRRLTRSPSDQQLSTADIDEYINTFVLYDFPQELRLFTFRKTLTFYTEPNIETYETSTTVGDPLYDFKNLYTAVFQPVYVGGYESLLSQSEAEFYGRYPFTNKFEIIGTGSGVNTITGTLSDVPILRNKVTFSTTEIITGNTMIVTDDGDGALVGDVVGPGTIDYETGAYFIEFIGAVENGADINALTVPYTAARPDTILYFDNKFTVRPVPDKVYPIQVEVDMRPSELLASVQSPDLEQWWQYIAYGGAKKVFEDRTDNESVQAIMPEFKRQEALVLRRTLVIQSKQRTSTIFSDGAWIGYGGSWRSGFGRS